MADDGRRYRVTLAATLSATFAGRDAADALQEAAKRVPGLVDRADPDGRWHIDWRDGPVRVERARERDGGTT